MNKTNTTIEEEYEKCIMCGEQTNVLSSTPIEQREFFEIGCGQLCLNCYLNLRDSSNRENAKLSAQIVNAIEHINKN